MCVASPEGRTTEHGEAQCRLGSVQFASSTGEARNHGQIRMSDTLLRLQTWNAACCFFNNTSAMSGRNPRVYSLMENVPVSLDSAA